MSQAAFIESPVLLPCRGEQMVGIIASPAGEHHPFNHDLGLVVIVGGPQYRAGSHRLFVRLCRDLAGQGITTLRFDVRGMGDSTGVQRSFEHLSDDIRAAVDGLQQQAPNIQRVVLWGLCDGASAALLYLHEQQDSRVAGLCLLNPWVRSEQTLAQTQVKHYYRDRLRQPEFWKKLASGGVGVGAITDLLSNLKRAAAIGTRRSSDAAPSSTAAEADLAFPARMALGLQRCDVPTLLTLSGRDYTAREFEEHAAADARWSRLIKRDGLEQIRLPEADHTLSGAASERQALMALSAWLQRIPTRQSVPGQRIGEGR